MSSQEIAKMEEDNVSEIESVTSSNRLMGQTGPQSVSSFTNEAIPDFDLYAEPAKEIVDAAIDNARVMVDNVISTTFKRLETQVLEREKTMESLQSRSTVSRDGSVISQLEDREVYDIGWPTIKDFNINLGLKKIDEYILTLEYGESWLYCIDFLEQNDFPYDKRFRYRARWSIPTRRKPIPRATASMYFTFVVSTIKPITYPVEVFYVFETNRLVHRPGKSRFREKWLKDIIDSKVITISGVDF